MLENFNYKYILYGILLLLIIGLYPFNYYLYARNTNVKNENIVVSDEFNNNESNVEKVEEKEIKKMYVEIKGEVKHPDVYSFVDGQRVFEVIKLAGGFTKNANRVNINLSKKLSDEMVIYVQNKTVKPLTISENNKTIYVEKECKNNTYDISSCISENANIIVEGTPEKSDTTSSDEKRQVNINTATIEELMTLNGIGEAKAQKIIKYREENGKFEKPEDIINVSGISENTYENIKEDITV